MNRFTLIQLEYNTYNGFIFSLFHVENNFLDNDLIGVDLSLSFLYIDLLFIRFKVFDKDPDYKRLPKYHNPPEPPIQ